MKLKQTITACALATAMLASTGTCFAADSASDFTDVSKSDWYYHELSNMVRDNVISGVTDTEFDPQGTLTLGQAIKLATCARCIAEQGNNTINITNSTGHWADGYASFAEYWGIIDSKPSEKEYDKVITRKKMAEIFARALEANEYNERNDFSEAKEQDVPEYVKTLYKAGIMVGDDNGSFRLNDSITRAETACIINRVLYKGERVEVNPPAPEPIVRPDAVQLPDNFKKDATDYAEKVLYYVNIEREKVGAPPLELDETLNAGAEKRADELIEVQFGSTAFQEKAREMGVHPNEIAHSRPGSSGYDYATVYADLGLTPPGSSVSENCGAGSLSAEDFVKGIMGSKGHRENMLNPAWRKMGVGRAYGTRVTSFGDPIEIVEVTEANFWVQTFSN